MEKNFNVYIGLKERKHPQRVTFSDVKEGMWIVGTNDEQRYGDHQN